MKLHKLSIVVILALTLSSCGTMRRAGKDLSVAVMSPGIMLYGGGVDGLQAAKEVREGLGGGALTEIVVLPPAFAFHAVKHLAYGFVHAADFFLFPFYGMADLHPYGPEIKPLDIYTGTIFDYESDSEDDSAGADVGGSR